MLNRERFISGVRSSTEFIASRVGIIAQTVAERLREPLQSTIGRIRGNWEHMDLRGRKRLGYAGVTAAAIGIGTIGVLLSDTILPGNTLSLIKIWAPAPIASMATWASLELQDVVTDRIQARHTPAS